MTTIKDHAQIFADIYNNNTWNDQESKSGPGSTIQATQTLVKHLPWLFSTFGIKSILDLPCGDFNWMKTVPLDGIKYTGADVVDELVRDTKNSHPLHDFIQLDLLSDLIPTVDLIICRDCLVHFSFHKIKQALFNICQSQSRYLLTTNFPLHTNSSDIKMGQWRPLNLELDPIKLSRPIFTINENLKSPHYHDKSMSLWSIDSIRLALLQ